MVIVWFQIELEIVVDGMTTACQDLDSLFSVTDNYCSRPNLRRCSVDTGPGANFRFIFSDILSAFPHEPKHEIKLLLFTGFASNLCNASCDCSTENCKLMLLANPGLKSTGWNVCEIKLMSPVPETTTTTTTTTTLRQQHQLQQLNLVFHFLSSSF